MGYHARLSPSGLHRYMRCPGSVREEAKCPESTSEAATDGTISHALLEHCVKAGLKDPRELVGVTLPCEEAGPIGFVVDQERAERVAVAIEYIRDRTAGEPVSIRSEERVDAGAIIGRDDVTGTADVQLVWDDMLEVIDYKDGYNPVSPENNEQLMAYALGAIRPYEKPGEGFPFRSVRLTIVQPKLREQGADPVQAWDTNVPSLMGFAERLREAGAACDAEDAPLVPGEIQCKWCRAKATCPKLQETALRGAQVLFQGTTDLVPATEMATLDAESLPSDRLREIIEAIPLINLFLTSVEEEALRRIQTGETIPGVKVVRGRGSRGWADPEVAETKLKGMGVPKSALYVSKLVSPAQAEKLTWESKGKKKNLTPKQLDKVRETLVEKKPGKLTVTLESDKREAVTFDAPTLFAGVQPNEEPAAIPAWLSN